MRYLILDSMGNAVDAFRTRVAAHATLRAIVDEEPDAADALVILAYDDAGRPAGEPITFDDLPPAVRVTWSSWASCPSSGLGRSARNLIRSEAPDHVGGATWAVHPPVRAEIVPH